MKRISILILFFLPIIISAEEITTNCKIMINDIESPKLTDNNENTYINLKNTDNIIIKCEENVNSVYIIYEMSSQIGKISNNERNIDIGTNNYLHEYINTEEMLSNEYQIKYNGTVKISEISMYSSGELPDDVEIWNLPHENADLVLFSTHSDDEQLFFLGLIPTYIAKGAKVQVVYFTHHNDNPKRLHEQLHGLYAIGVRNYPITGIIPDAWSETLEGALNNLKKANLNEEDAINFQVEMIRKFKPLVVVGHDEKGEYSHGQHILNTYTLKKALLLANDENYHNESKNKYGVWDTPKVYLHLYKENEIIMDYDTPLEYFNNKTAYQIAKIGYSKHKSQQWTWFTEWLNGKNNEYTKSIDIKTYSPNKYGLYKSTVGEDKEKNDMFENLSFRKDEDKNEINDEIKEPKSKPTKTIKNNQKEKFLITLILLLFLVIIITKKIKTKDKN